MKKEQKIKLTKKLNLNFEQMELYSREGGLPCAGQCGCSANPDYTDDYCHCGSLCGCGCGGC